MSTEKTQPFLIATTKDVRLTSEKIELLLLDQDVSRLKTKATLNLKISIKGKPENGTVLPQLRVVVDAIIDIALHDEPTKPLARYESQYQQVMAVDRYEGIEQIASPPINTLDPYLRPLFLTIVRRAELGLVSIGIATRLPAPMKERYEPVNPISAAKKKPSTRSTSSKSSAKKATKSASD